VVAQVKQQAEKNEGFHRQNRARWLQHSQEWEVKGRYIRERLEMTLKGIKEAKYVQGQQLQVSRYLRKKTKKPVEEIEVDQEETPPAPVEVTEEPPVKSDPAEWMQPLNRKFGYQVITAS
jgi:hypothetical protein